MSRVYEVVLGAALIFCLWCWALESLAGQWAELTGWLAIVMAVSKLWVACLITAPLYREYLR